MSKAFVVLVSLFIGFSSGFIVPSGVAKAIHNASKSVFNIKKDNSTKNNLIKINKINESEIYQNIDNKTNNVNERSFILINRKFKKMRSNQLFRAVAQGLIGQSLNNVKSPHEQLQTYTTRTVQYKLAEAISSPDNLFEPNFDKNKEPQYVPSVYRYEYPDPPVIFQRNKTDGDIKNLKQNPKFKDNKSKWTPVGSEPIVRVKSVHMKPPNYKSDDTIGNTPRKSKENVTVKSEQKPGSLNKKMRITSFTQRKPNQYHNCGFLKPNLLHHSSFLKKLDGSTADDHYSPIHIDGPNLDSSLGNMYDDDDNKLERYIKETLAETGKHLSKEVTEPSHEKCATETSNQDDDETVGTDERNSLSKLDELERIIENANIESK